MRKIAALIIGLSLLAGSSWANPLPRIDGLHFDLTQTSAGNVSISGGTLTLTSPAGTDLFNPKDKPVVHTAPMVTFTPPEGDFVFTVKTHTALAAAYDGPGLVVWGGPDYWAKLMFEAINDKTSALSSSFATPISDNSYHSRFPVSTDNMWLKVMRFKTSVLFYASTDGQTWEIVRDFSIDPARPLSIGVFVQTPLGKSLTTQFSEFRFESRTITRYWDGE